MKSKFLLLFLLLAGSSQWVESSTSSEETSTTRPSHSFFYNFFYRVYNDFFGRNNTEGEAVNNTGRQIGPVVLSPAEVVLIRQQQQRQQAIAIAQLNEAIIRNRDRDEDDSSSEEDDDTFSDPIWGGRPLRQRGSLHGPGGIPGNLGYYRSEETFDSFNGTSGEIEARQAAESTTEESTTEESTTEESTTEESTTEESTTEESTTEESTTEESTTEETTESTTEDTTESTTEDTTESTTDTTESTERPKIPPYRGTLHCRCGTQTKTKVPFGSSTLETNIYPWIVSIQTKQAHLCTGNIINSKYILTTASCVKRHRNPKKLIVEASLATPGRTKKYQVQRVIIRPDYHPTKREHDIALLEVKQQIHPTQFIKFVCLPIGDKHTEDAGTLVTLTKDTKPKPANQAQTKKLSLIQELVQPVGVSRCKQLMNQNKASLPNEAFCTAPPAQHCNGDAGGSFVTKGQGYSFAIKGLLINSGCYKGKKPAIYTQVTKYMNWVLNNAKLGQYCKLPNFRYRLQNLNKHNNQV